MTTNIAFFGAGDTARPYLDALARRGDVQLVGVCDPHRRAAEQVAAGWGAPVFGDQATMLQQACPDVLWVCVPPALQGDVLPRAVEQRVPFFVLPPGALNHERAREYGQLVREANLVSSVGFASAYTDVAREAREYLGTNVVPLALGWWLRPAEEPSAEGALALLWNEGCVLIDALRYFCGDVEQVQAFAPGGEEKGSLVLHLRFRRGTVGVATLATFRRPEPRVEVELSGEGWSLTLGEGLGNLRVAETDKITLLKRLNVPAEEQVKTFLEAAAAGDPALTPTGYLDALTTLSICAAASQSVREGRSVVLSASDA